ncbi:MAG TPA: TonB family protein [Thermoanaerobaculia bacterium]|nr:TonB family protein [Thermoanaerobaculia bacterium]
MDLQKELLESSKKNGQKGGWKASATSVALHALLVAGVVYAGSQTATHKVDSEKQINAFITQGAAPPPPPPPPPPPKSSGAPKQQVQPRVQPKPVQVTPMTPPVEIPKEIPKVTMPATKNLPVVDTPVVEEDFSTGGGSGPGDAVNGVEGGVEGGVAGGVVGGEVGGVVGGEIGGTVGGELGGKLGGQIGGTGTGNDGTGTGGVEAPVAPPPPPPPPPSGPLRVGGDVKAPVTVERVDPKYTETARAAKVAGIVVVEAVIGKDGRVQSVNTIKGLPMGLSEQAETAVRRWRFKPGTLNGQPVATIFTLTVTFKLD